MSRIIFFGLFLLVAYLLVAGVVSFVPSLFGFFFSSPSSFSSNDPVHHFISNCETIITKDVTSVESMNDIKSIPISKAVRFAGAARLSARTMDDLRTGARRQFPRIPDDVFEQIADMAFSPSLERNSNFFFDTVVDMEGGASTFMYLGFYYTVNGQISGGGRGEEDKSCETHMIVAGIEIKMPSVIVGYKTYNVTRVVDYERSCFFRCSTRPILVTETRQIPIYSQNFLNLDGQKALIHELMHSALDAAKTIVDPATHGRIASIDDMFINKDDKLIDVLISS